MNAVIQCIVAGIGATAGLTIVLIGWLKNHGGAVALGGLLLVTGGMLVTLALLPAGIHVPLDPYLTP